MKKQKAITKGCNLINVLKVKANYFIGSECYYDKDLGEERLLVPAMCASHSKEIGIPCTLNFSPKTIDTLVWLFREKGVEIVTIPASWVLFVERSFVYEENQLRPHYRIEAA